MIELPDRTVLLREGEPVPYRCLRCETLYVPGRPLAKFSFCPRCRNCNDHRQQTWQVVPAPDEEVCSE